jgi:hypothetical protein
MTPRRPHPSYAFSMQVLVPEEFEIRSGLGARAVQGGVFAAGSFLAVIGTIALIGRGSPWAALAGTATVVWITYFYRLIGLAVIASTETLEVRNLYRTRRVSRQEVRAVSMAESTVAKSPSQTVVVHLANGHSLPLDACARRVQSRRRLRRVEEYQRRIRNWAEAA